MLEPRGDADLAVGGEGTVNETNQTLDASNIQGTFDTSADVFGLQFTYNWEHFPWEGLPYVSEGSGS